jgi:surface carbohydrate biosynthesis protein
MLRMLLRVLKSIYFIKHDEYDICLFGGARQVYLDKIILGCFRYGVVEYDISRLLNRGILINLTIFRYYFQYLAFNRVKGYSLKKQVYYAYMFAQVKAMNPSIVITLLGQYTLWYGQLSNHFPEIKFYGLPWTDFRAIYAMAVIPSRVKYFVFGDHEKKIFNQHNLNNETLIPLGSLIGGFYLNNRYNKDINYDICFISQVDNIVYGSSPVSVPGYNTNTLFETQAELLRYISELQKTKGVSICVVARMQEGQMITNHEKVFIEKHLDCEYTYIANDGMFSSYEAMLTSRIVINTYSTIALDAMARGIKVLYYDPMKAFGEKTEPMMWSVKKNKFAEFEKIYQNLLSVSFDEYVESIVYNVQQYNNISWERPLYKELISLLANCFEKKNRNIQVLN